MYPQTPHKFPTTVIVSKHLLQPVILGLDFSAKYLIEIDWFSTNQLYLHQGPKSIIVSGPAPFPLYVNQISTLPLLHILVRKVSQVTIPSRTLAIVPTTFNGTPKFDCSYDFIEISYKSQQNIFVLPVLKIVDPKLPLHLLCIIINMSPDNIFLPKKTGILVKLNCSVTLMTLNPPAVNEVTHNINCNHIDLQ